ncbi:MAG: hypothetical protein H6575_16110 [Lewinellaceae bacterium]|nr:hypothetical protein [Lewinellaceae bacterium]
MAQKDLFPAFSAHQVSQLNKICGGVKNTTWTSQTTGTDYKDYKYGKNELNETDQYVDYGGTDKTFQPV